MLVLAGIIVVLMTAAIVALNLWYRRYLQAETRRRSQLSPEALAEEDRQDLQDWADRSAW